MSVFYQSLPYNVARSFKKRKQRFKRGKPCAVCGKMYPPDEMMVAHKKPAHQLTDREALYDVKNWEVRCIYCERHYNRLHPEQNPNHGDIIENNEQLNEGGDDARRV